MLDTVEFLSGTLRCVVLGRWARRVVP